MFMANTIWSSCKAWVCQGSFDFQVRNSLLCIVIWYMRFHPP